MALPRVLCRARLILNTDIFAISKCNLVTSVSINKTVYVKTVRHFRTHFTSNLVSNTNRESEKTNQSVSSSSSSSESSSSSSSSDSESDSDCESDEVTVDYHKGLPQLTVPLPSRRERCKFTLKPLTNTVGDFLEMLRKEDRGIDRAVCRTKTGTRIAASNTIETLLDEDFVLVINDLTYDVCSPKHERVTGEEIQRLNDVKNVVSQLYEAMHVQEHQMTKEKELVAQLETIKQELMPLETIKQEIELTALRRSDWLSWTGLGLMSVQFGILARLTWWEYSWDIMEPVTYFVTYGTAMACYAYFVLTKEEYILQDVRNRQQLLVLHKKSKRLGLNIDQYNMLKQESARIEYMLKKLRNPLKLKLPPKPAGLASAAADPAATPATLSTLVTPATPATPATPLTPTTPATPVTPTTPAAPATPGTPVTPAGPATPATPASPAAPGSPVTVADKQTVKRPAN